MDKGETDNDLTPMQLNSLERQLMEVLHELHMKRRLLRETQKEIEEGVLKHHQLEQSLDQEKRDSEALRLQLKVALSAVQQYGEVKNTSQAELSRLRVDKEISTRERDSLKQQCHTLKLENITLTHRLEELQAQLHCQQLYQDRCSEQEMKVTEAMNVIRNEMQAFDQDKKRLERSVSLAEETIGKMKISHKQSIFLLQKYSEEQKKHEALIVELRAQISSLKHEKKSQQTFSDNGTSDLLERTNQYLLELKEFVTAESKGNDKLTDAIQKSLEAQGILEKQERDAREKLECHLQELSKLQESNEALKNKLQESEETIRKLRDEVKETKLTALSSEKGKEDYRDEQVQTEEETVPGVTSTSLENADTG